MNARFAPFALLFELLAEAVIAEFEAEERRERAGERRQTESPSSSEGGREHE
mgnify:CR=1 FL=1